MRILDLNLGFQALFLTFLLLNLSCSAEPESRLEAINTEKSEAPAISTSTAEKATQKRHTLWKIEGETNTVYLMGSIHMLPPELYPLPQAYDLAFNDAEKLVFEIDESILDQQLAQKTVQEYAQLAPGQKLKDLLDPDDYTQIRTLAKEKNVPMFMIDPFDPWFSGLTLVSMQYLNAGLSPEYGIDQHYMQRGIKAGKPISGLETMQEQFSMFDSMSIDMQAEMLIETLKQEIDVKEFIDSMIEEWQEGDMSALQALLQEDFTKYPEMYDILLVNRNKNWIPQITSLFTGEDDYLVIVGAAHMLGDQGVIRLLEAEGFTVEQL